MSYEVKSVSGDEVTLDAKMESVDSRITGDAIGGNMEKLFEKLQGGAFTVTLKKGQVSKVTGYEDLIKKIADGDEGTAKMAKMLLSEESLKKSFNDAFGSLPTEPISEGKSWKQDSDFPLGPIGAFKIAKDCTYKEKDKDGIVVTYKSKLTYVPPAKGDAAFGGLLKIVKGNLKADNAKGSYTFDAEKGRLVSATQSMVARGTLTVEVMGNQLELDVTIDQNTKTRVLNKNPKSD